MTGQSGTDNRYDFKYDFKYDHKYEKEITISFYGTEEDS